MGEEQLTRLLAAWSEGLGKGAQFTLELPAASVHKRRATLQEAI